MKNLKIAIKDDTRDTYQEGYLLNVHIDTKAIVDLIYPVGSTITTLNIHFNPNVQYAGTTWTTIKEGVFLQSTQNSSEVGTEMSPGLPNIYGTFDGNTDDGSAAKTGAFYAPGWGFNGSNGSTGGGYIVFDASRYNSIYGNSTTVQPPAIKCFIWQRTA